MGEFSTASGNWPKLALMAAAGPGQFRSVGKVVICRQEHRQQLRRTIEKGLHGCSYLNQQSTTLVV
jgi:hypothetical protein